MSKVAWHDVKSGYFITFCGRRWQSRQWWRLPKPVKQSLSTTAVSRPRWHSRRRRNSCKNNTTSSWFKLATKWLKILFCSWRSITVRTFRKTCRKNDYDKEIHLQLNACCLRRMANGIRRIYFLYVAKHQKGSDWLRLPLQKSPMCFCSHASYYRQWTMWTNYS